MSLLQIHPIIPVFFIGLALGLFSHWYLARGRQAVLSTGTGSKVSHELFFEGDELVGASAAARMALSPDDLEDAPLKRLTERLAELFPNFPRALGTARAEGARFELSETTSTGPVKVDVTCTGNLTRFVVSGMPDLMASRILMDRAIAAENDRELKVLRSTVSTAPTIIWREDRKGEIDWVNGAYTSLLDNIDAEPHLGWPPQRLFDGASITAPGDTAQPRRAPLTLRDGTTRWYDITSFGHGNSTLHYANDASKTVQAEEALRNFMQTLTQTFASLPIGLAIFDRQRQLQLFNPALLDLTTLEPEWLASRPTLYDFINRMREKRMLPERKDFRDWRAKLNELEKSAVNGTYLETWNLPTGQTYKVTGRPHPEGAVAFLIEDISAEISLTRKFRRELEVSQSMIDSLPDAIAVFDTDGNLSISNEAYCGLWSMDPELVLDQTGIVEATRSWQKKSLPTPLWGDVREFVCHAGERTEWFGSADLIDGRQMACRFVPLAGGATLVSFAEPSESPAPVKELAELTN